MWTVSAFQMHPKALFVCDDDATLELRVKTVKYFKGLMDVHNQLVKDQVPKNCHVVQYQQNYCIEFCIMLLYVAFNVALDGGNNLFGVTLLCHGEANIIHNSHHFA